MFDDEDTQETKNICDYVLDDIETNDVLFEHVPIDDKPNYPSPPDPLPSFSDILLPKTSLKKGSQKNFKKVPKDKTKQRQGKKSNKKRYPKAKKSKIYPNR